MPKAPKMVNLAIEETSGVDHPAHLHEGWMVIKASNPTEVNEIVASLVSKSDDEPTQSPDTGSGNEGNKEESMPEETLSTEAAAEETKPAAEETPAPEAPVAEAAPAAEDDVAKAAETPVTADDFLKSAPEAVRNMVEALKKSADDAAARAAAAEAELQKSKDAALDAEAIEKAKAWAHLSLDAEVVGKALRRLTAIDADLAKSIEEVLSSVNAQAESANIFAEIGKSAGIPEGATAFDRMTALAKSAVDKGEAKTFEQAFANVAGSNPDLYTQYLNEKAGA